MESRIANFMIGIGLVLTAFAAMVALPTAVGAADMGWGTPSPLQIWQEGTVTDPELADDPGGNAFAAWAQSDGTRYNIMANMYSVGLGRWDVPSAVQNGPFDGFSPSVAADGSGNVLAVWRTWNGERWAICSSRYLGGTGWTPSTQIDMPTYGDSYDPRVDSNPSGFAVAVWTQYTVTMNMVYSNIFQPGIGWTGPAMISPVSAPSTQPQVAVDDSGNAFAVWMEFSGENSISVSRYSAGSWSPRIFLESNPGEASYPRVGVDSTGNATFVWKQSDGIRDNVFANRYDTMTGWGIQTLLESSDGQVAGIPEIAVNGAGQAWAVWSQYDGTYYSIYANMYDPVGGVWGTATAVELLSENSLDSDVAIDPSGTGFVVYEHYDPTNNWYNAMGTYVTPGPVINPSSYLENFDDDATSLHVKADNGGNAMVVWMQWFDKDKRYSLYSNRYVAGSGWTSATRAEFDDEGGASYMRLAANIAGAAIASWTQDDGPVSDAYASAYNPATGWTNAKLLERDNRGDALDTAAGIADSGDGIVVWRQWNGTNFAIYASHYLYGLGWTFPLAISSSGGDSLPPQIAVNGAGTAFVAWRSWDGVTKRLWAIRYVPGTGWEIPFLVDSSVPNDILDPVVAIDDAGNAIIVDSIWDSGQYSIYAYNYVVGTGWGASRSLESLPNHSLSPRIAMNGNGDAVVSWNNLDGADFSVYATFYSPGLGWSGFSTVENLPGETYAAPVAIDSNGNAYATWQQWDGVNWNVFVSRGNRGSGWGAPMPIVNYPSTTTNPNVAVNRAGLAVVLYTEADGDRSKPGYFYSTYARRYDPAAGWGPSQLLEWQEGDAWAGDVQVDGAGNAAASFLQFDGVRVRPWANRYVVGDGSPRLTLTSPTMTLTNNPNVIVAGITDPHVYLTVNGVSVAVDNLGFFSYPTTLFEGLNTFTVVARNLAFMTKTVTASVTLDTMPPSLFVATPANGTIANTPTVTVTGVTEPGAGVVVNGLDVRPVSSGWFNVNVSLLEGLNTITVVATDQATNSQTMSVMITLDTIVPSLLLTSPSVPLTKNPNVLVAGQTDPGASVAINGTSVAVDPFGGFSKTVTLPDGEHKFVVVATDLAGNTAAETASIDVDTTAPNLVVTSPVDGSLTRDPLVSVIGTTDPGADVLVNGIATLPDSSGGFTVQLLLREGITDIQVVAIDPAGNSASVSVFVTVDTIAPSLRITLPTENSFTNNPSVLVTGVTEPGAGLAIDGVPVAVQPAGDFSQSFILPDETHVFDIRATDMAGNVAQTTRTVTVDTILPGLTVDSPAQAIVVQIPSVLVSGSTEPTAGLTVNSQVVQVQPSGDFTVAVALLVVGQNVITVVATDQAGNANTVQRTVFYAAPDIPGMQQNITELQRQIASLLDLIDELNGTIDDLNNKLQGRMDDTDNNITTLMNLLANLTQSLGQAQRDLNTVKGDLDSISNVLVMSMAILIVTLFIGLAGIYLALSRKMSSLRGPQSDLEEVEGEEAEDEELTLEEEELGKESSK